MSNAKKIIDASKTNFDVVRKQRTRKIKIDLDTLDDAIVNGKLVVPVKGRVVFERVFYNNRVEIHEGFIVSVSDTGLVEIYDETREQCYAFEIGKPHPKVKSLNSVKNSNSDVKAEAETGQTLSPNQDAHT